MAALLNVARISGNKPVPYGTVSAALNIEEDEVEQWIVKASGEKMMTARIDQIHRAISITTCVGQGFHGG